MSEIKRVWSGKRITRNNKEQVWEKDWELKVYDGQWKDVDGDIDVYKGSQFETLPWEAELDIYDTNEPTFIGTVEDWINAAYVFKDWDGTVLKTGKVKDGWTPTPPANPSREHYDFTWWNPEVWPIYKSTEYVAQYELNTTIIINEDLSTTNVEVWETFQCYFTCPNAVTFSDSTMWLEDTSLTTDGWYKVYSWTVIAAGNFTLTIRDNVVPWMTASLNVTSVMPPRYRINEHTKLYAPLETNLNAESYTGSVSYEVLGNSSNITFHYDQWMRYAEFAKTDGENGWFVRYAIWEIGTKENQTATAWVKPSELGQWLVAWFEKNWNNQWISNGDKWFMTHGQNLWDQISSITADRAWHMLTVTVWDDSTAWRIKMYIDWQLALSFMSREPDATVTEVILWWRWVNSAECGWDGWIADFIIEDTVWSAQDVADYYNYTKNRYPIPTYTVTIESNDDTKWTVDISTVTAELWTAITVNGNTLTIGNTTVTATAESWNFFFTYTGVTATVGDNMTIIAQFEAEWVTPSLTFNLGDVSWLVQTPLSVPWYKISSINVSWTTWANPQRRWWIWLAVSNDDGTFSAASSSKWFGSYFFVGTKQWTDGAYSWEEKSSANAVNTLYRASDLWYGWIPTSLSVIYDASSAEYIYGQDDTTYTFSSYSYDIEPLLERDDLNFAVRWDGCTFDSVQVSVVYEKPFIRELDNLSSNDVTVFEWQTTSVTFDYIPTSAVDLDQDINIYSDNNYCSVDWNKISDWRIQLDITGVGDGSLSQSNDTVYIELDWDIWESISVTINPYVVTSVSNLSANSITLEPQQRDNSITFDYSPTDADTANVEISNSDDTVVSASLYDNADGTMNIELDALSIGTATLEIMLDWVWTWLTVAVTVDFDNIKSVSNLSANSIALFEGDSDSSITFDYLPVDAADTSNVSIISDDPNIADAALSDLWNGVMEVDINALSAWTATLDIQLDWVSTWLTVTVTVDIDNIKSISNLSASSIRIPENNQDTVTFDYSPTDAADTSNVTVVSDDDSIATASLTDLWGQMEVVISTGNAWTATLDIQLNWVSTWETITVTVYTLTRITTVDTQPLTIGEGATGLIEFHYTPSDTTDFSNITAVSDDDNIATTSFYGYSSWEAHFQISWVAEWSTSVTITDGVNDYPVQVIVTTPWR